MKLKPANQINDRLTVRENAIFETTVQEDLNGGVQLHRSQTAKNNSVVGSHLPPQKEKPTQGQKPAHHCMKKPATVSQKTVSNTTLYADARRNTQTVMTEQNDSIS